MSDWDVFSSGPATYFACDHEVRKCAPIRVAQGEISRRRMFRYFDGGQYQRTVLVFHLSCGQMVAKYFSTSHSGNSSLPAQTGVWVVKIFWPRVFFNGLVVGVTGFHEFACPLTVRSVTNCSYARRKGCIPAHAKRAPYHPSSTSCIWRSRSDQ